MAVYIPIRMIERDGDRVEYRYTVGSRTGRVSLDLSTGEVSSIEDLGGEFSNAHLARVMHVLQGHWGRQEIPEKTCWAS